MALKGRGASKVLKGIKTMAQGVQKPIEENPNRKKQRTTTGKPLPAETPTEARKTKEFSKITLHGSKGEKYTVVVPSSYMSAIPKVWEWTAERYKVAELIADGMPIAQIPNHPAVTIRSRMTIYGWMEHPEFKSHIDGLIMETGWANRRERINNLQYINNLLLAKLAREADSVKMTDKSLGAILSALQQGSKLIAQEKGEFIEESKVTQDTNISGTLKTATLDVNDFIKSQASEEQKELMKEFESMGDDIIRSLTGEKTK
jgi:hypothetical protein